jgi:hypothetical protein
MSIRQNLRILNKPISELAMLPQETIMTMAQSGQIPVAFVAPILAEKAEASQRAVEVEAMMAQQQMPPGSVIEKIIAQNAANEAQTNMPMMAPSMPEAQGNMPMMGAQMPQMSQMPQPEDVGIGALPVSDEMIPELAGGGIIAFKKGDLVKDESDPSGYDTVGFNRNAASGLDSLDSPFSGLKEEAERLKAAKEAFVGPNQSVADLIAYNQEAEKRAAERAKSQFNTRLIEAGLLGLGGDSEYFGVNMGRMAPAVKGMSEDTEKQAEAKEARIKSVLAAKGIERRENEATFTGALAAREDFRKAKFDKEKFEAEQQQARDKLQSEEVQAAAERVNRLKVAETPGETERLAETIMAESGKKGESITYEEAARRAKNALTAPPDRYNALSNRLNSANKDITTRTFMLQQLLATASESEKKAINDEIEAIRKQVLIDYSITPADLAELQAHRSTGTSTTKPPPITRSADGKFKVVTPEGQTFSFPNQQAAEQFNSQIRR